MDIDCVICLTKTDLDQKFLLCSQCGKLACHECVDTPQFLKTNECPHCKYSKYRKGDLTKLFCLLERDNIDSNIIYNAIGCWLFLKDSAKGALNFLEKSNLNLATQNKDLITSLQTKNKYKYNFKFGEEDHFCDLLCVPPFRITKYMKLFNENIYKDEMLEMAKVCYKGSNFKACVEIADSCKGDPNFLIYLVAIELFSYDNKSSKKIKIKKQNITKERALKLIEDLKKLSDMKIPLAMLELGRLYMYKFSGFLEPNYYEAKKLFEQLPEWPEALYYLGHIYLNGCGVEVDLLKGLDYLKESVIHKDKWVYPIVYEFIDYCKESLNDNTNQFKPKFPFVVEEDSEEEETDDSDSE